MKKVLVMGNGPSLKDLDFKKLKNIDTVGMNAAYRYWEKINFYPTYYCCLDNVVVVSHQEQIKNLIDSNRIKKFFLHENILIKYPELKNIENIMIFNSKFNKDQSNIFFNNFVTTGSYSIRWMIDLGYTDIGLLGIDCNYVEKVENSESIGKNKLIITNNSSSNPNYFFEDYQKEGDKYNIPNNPICKVNHSVHLDSVDRIFEDCKRLNKDVNIINTTFKNNLDFEYVMSIDDFLNFENRFNFKNNTCVLLTKLHDNLKQNEMENYFKSFQNNYLNRYISKIYIFIVTSNNNNLNNFKTKHEEMYKLISKKKFTIKYTNNSPSKLNFINFVNQNFKNGKFIISNTCISFDNSLEKIYNEEIKSFNKFYTVNKLNIKQL
jgi:hypothetical protein